MHKKLHLLLLILPLALSGCNSSHKIESASVIESVSVQEHGGRLSYTFYPLTDSSSPDAVSVPAASFEEARRIAGESYIPDLSLAKLELLLYSKDTDGGVLKRDIEYISTQASFSPIAYLALCDENTLRLLRKKTEAQSAVKEQLLLCRRQHPEVNIDYLSVFNRYARRPGEGFSVPYLSAEPDLRVSTVEIND